MAAISWLQSLFNHPCNALGPHGNAIGCSYRFASYVVNTAFPHALQNTLQLTLQTTGWALDLLGEHLASPCLSAIAGRPIQVRVTDIFANTIAPPLYQAANLTNQIATNLLVSAPLSEIREESGFRASDLLTPALWSNFCAYKTYKNFLIVATSVTSLIRGQLLKTTEYKLPSDAEAPQVPEISIIEQEKTTRFNLCLNILQGALWAAAWGSSSYYTYQSMVDTLTGEGVSYPLAERKVGLLIFLPFAAYCLSQAESALIANRIQTA